MAYSTSHYFLKPIVPRITIGVTINGINLIQFNAKSMHDLVIDKKIREIK
jgi:hypothetical protein